MILSPEWKYKCIYEQSENNKTDSELPEEKDKTMQHTNYWEW